MSENPNRTRDHLANERTFLAWIRTSIALMGFGFVIVKFAVFLKQAALMLGREVPLMPTTYSAEIGIAMVGFGALTALMGFTSFNKNAKQIEGNTYNFSQLNNLVVTSVIILISLILIYFLLPTLK